MSLESKTYFGMGHKQEKRRRKSKGYFFPLSEREGKGTDFVYYLTEIRVG